MNAQCGPPCRRRKRVVKGGGLDHVSRKIERSFHNSQKNKIDISRFTEKKLTLFFKQKLHIMQRQKKLSANKDKAGVQVFILKKFVRLICSQFLTKTHGLVNASQDLESSGSYSLH